MSSLTEPHTRLRDSHRRDVVPPPTPRPTVDPRGLRLLYTQPKEDWEGLKKHLDGGRKPRVVLDLCTDSDSEKFQVSAELTMAEPKATLSFAVRLDGYVVQWDAITYGTQGEGTGPTRVE